MKRIIAFIFLNFIASTTIFAQKMDSDSLLVQTLYQINTVKNYPKAIQLGQLGIKIAPDYLDFHVALGRCYMLTKNIDSSRIYFNHVIDKNPKYKEAFIYLTKLELEKKNASNAIRTIDKALLHYPEEKEFHLLKLQAVNLEKNDEKSILLLNDLVQKYPTDSDLKHQLIELKSKSVSDRVGINYNYTTFDRSGTGPWHLLGLQYIRERKKLTLIGRINYADRRSFGESINSGIQYELETYFLNNKKSYSLANISYSKDIVFPKLRLSYSYFHNLSKGWEGDVGIRYTKTSDKDLYAAVLGIGKYVGSYWFNLRSYVQMDEDKIYPAFTATARYYFDTKYDYATIITGYGTTPDERVTLGQFQQRVALDSYRIGAGYYKLFGQHYCTGVQAVYNRQEYVSNNFQNEFDVFLSVQYKF
ncbi:YaiO family outer membrane beta-barrel protein [Flavobacterium sp.]|uniref:YaiO family outer membrane beta-barrel protein n=1 Tax=Flavobacterium sp. TaxID=239 RepID=UPI002B4ABBD4|nr:YaiO family outer membrane beta-barrel protein [Flavobacterium sp.]HLF53152.1 YaiO family outer membrane beta-barrel protein [Flavobacterium sp.]